MTSGEPAVVKARKSAEPAASPAEHEAYEAEILPPNSVRAHQLTKGGLDPAALQSNEEADGANPVSGANLPQMSQADTAAHRASSARARAGAGSVTVGVSSAVGLAYAPGDPLAISPDVHKWGLTRLNDERDRSPKRLGSRPTTSPETSPISSATAPSHSAKTPWGEGSQLLGLTATEVDEVRNLLASAPKAEVAGPQADQPNPVPAPAVQAIDIEIAIDKGLLRAERLNDELAIRFLTLALGGHGLRVERPMAEEIIRRLGLTPLLDDQRTRDQVRQQLPFGRIVYRSTAGSVNLAIAEYHRIRARWRARYEQAVQELHKSTYAEDAILDFYIAHLRAIITTINGLLDLPMANVNLPLVATGGESLVGLGRIPTIDYRGPYGKHYGEQMQFGAELGIFFAGGWISKSPLLAGVSARALSVIANLVGKRAGLLIKAVNLLMLSSGVSSLGLAGFDAKQIIESLQSGQIVENGKARPLNDNDIVALLGRLLMHVVTGGAAIKSVLGGRVWARMLARRARLIEASGAPSGVRTHRPHEVPYTRPLAGVEVARIGQPVDVGALDPRRRYLWVLDAEGNFSAASEGQGSMFPNRPRLSPEHPQAGQTPLKHGDLVPGEGGLQRGAARAGGELRAETGADGRFTGRWLMDNNSSYTHQRIDGTYLGGAQLNAAYELLGTTGTDTSRIVPVNTNGFDAPSR